MNYKDITHKDGEYDPRRDVLARMSIGGDEYYTLPLHAEDIAKSLNIGPSTIWTPFDTEDSEIVKALTAHGHKVIHTHIKSGEDFFEIQPPKCDAIISNPPFSRKKEVLQRIKELNKPFVLLLPALWINDGVPFDFGDQMIWWRKRVRFTTEAGTTNTPRTTCFALSNGLLKKDLIIFMH